MANGRLAMSKVKEILRLSYVQHISQERIAIACQSSKGSVWKILKLAKSAGLTTWEDVEHHSEAQLEERLYGPAPETRSLRVLPDWAWVHSELRNKHVTRLLLWEEYKAQHDGQCTLGLSQFCELYAQWRKGSEYVMRQSHAPGEKLFIDFAGDSIAIVNKNGQASRAHLFVGVLGMSNYTFAMATADETKQSWISAQARALEFFGGVPEIIVPDNPRALVNKAHRYEPELNPEYAEFARHYNVAVVPARVRKPRDKAKVENGVLIAQRWILARLRKRTFLSLADLNNAISELVTRMNDKPFRKLPGSRTSMFLAHERPVLRALPEERYVVPEWKNARVGVDYHVEFDGHYYSAPFRYRGEKVRLRATETSIEIFVRDERIAAHVRSRKKGHHTFVLEHLPKSHREYLDWTPEKLLSWAAGIGPSTHILITRVLESRGHPTLGFRSAFGILSLSKSHEPALVEAARECCLQFHGYSYRHVDRVLKAIIAQQHAPKRRENSGASHECHDNVRGAEAFKDEHLN